MFERNFFWAEKSTLEAGTLATDPPPLNYDGLSGASRGLVPDYKAGTTPAHVGLHLIGGR